MSEEEIKRLVKQNDVIIALLGRMVFKAQQIKDMVAKKKQNPDNYIRGYNACDGKHTVSQIAQLVGVTQGTLTPILQEWEEAGIIRDIEKPGGKFYKKLFPI
ncbi:MAG: winged helix-turn-helix domain-containing protein [Candidatus Bathyarchaeia archaeon]